VVVEDVEDVEAAAVGPLSVQQGIALQARMMDRTTGA
jgi:hypothetical protein